MFVKDEHPEMELTNIINIALLIAFLWNTGLGLLVYFRPSPHRTVNVSFSLFTWALAGWALSILLMFLFIEPNWKLFWGRMSFLAASNIGSTFLFFSLVFPREMKPVSSVKRALIFLPSTLFAFISMTDWMVRSVRWDTMTVNYGPAHSIFSIYIILAVSGGIVSLIRSYRHSVGLERLQVKYCFLGTFIATLPATTLNLILPLLGTSRLSHLGPATTLIMVSFITYSILEHRLMDINIVLKKGTTYVFLMLLLFVPSSLLIVYAEKVFFHRIDYLFSVITLLTLFFVALFFNIIKRGTEKAVEQLFFRNHYDYRETLGKFSKAMVTILDLQSLSKKIIETITQTMGVEKASLFLLNEEKGGYYLLESKKVTVTLPPSGLPQGDPLPRYLQNVKEVVVREELSKGVHVQELATVVQSMTELQAEVSIPLISKGQLTGMINLSHKFNRDVYSHEDIELLFTLANQASIAVENARLYEDLKRSKSYIRRADRLASLGTLTAGLAHEIRNPLVAIKTLTQLLPDRLEDEEFRNHFLQIASGEVDRISSLVNELLEFARPSEPKLEMEDINAILEGMLLLISTETKKKFVQVVKEYTPDLPLVRVDREQIKQVFLNVLLNALEATPENGAITVKTRSFLKPGGEHYVQVEVTDTGCGIPSEYLEDIFTPFFTTKIKGSGLGLSISNQIIQDHKGYIDVESYVNRGSTFFINLPISQDHPKRRKNDSEEQRHYVNPLERQ